MAFRDHLIPKTVIRSDGVITTVYVKPEDRGQDVSMTEKVLTPPAYSDPEPESAIERAVTTLDPSELQVIYDYETNGMKEALEAEGLDLVYDSDNDSLMLRDRETRTVLLGHANSEEIRAYPFDDFGAVRVEVNDYDSMASAAKAARSQYDAAVEKHEGYVEIEDGKYWLYAESTDIVNKLRDMGGLEDM